MSKTEINTNKLLELENKLQIYRRALEFYADEDNYLSRTVHDSIADTSVVEWDNGEKAREALKSE